MSAENEIRPRNRTARAAVIGNPASARLDAAVGNCFPGLELDVRNLDGRFFPGLLFRVVAAPVAPLPGTPLNEGGARLVVVDWQNDPMLPERSTEPWVVALLAQLSGDVGNTLSRGRWYLQWVEQGGKRISCLQPDGQPWDGKWVWRFLRSLVPDEPLAIGLVNRDAPTPQAVIELHGYRRRYTTPDGVISPVFEPGELTQSLCNPWQHDFRDCACYYWASNHPDVVLGESSANVDGQPEDATTALTYLDWLRRDRTPAGEVAAPDTRTAARPDQIDHFEINQRWQELNFVIGGREIGAVYTPPKPDHAKPYASAEALVDALENELAPMEMTLAIEYLYSLFSLRSVAEAPADRWPTLPDDLLAVRQSLTLVAVSEMTHLRWVNQLLWELGAAGFYPPGRHYTPVVRHSRHGPIGLHGLHQPALRVLDPQALQAYIRVERPGGPLDRAYARCVATLEQPQYPRHLYELAVKIDTDGVQHWERFKDMHNTLARYFQATPLPYLRHIRLGHPKETAAALETYEALVAELRKAYADEAQHNFAGAQLAISRSRALMTALNAEAEALAARGIGIPFFSVP
ncbi:ferritin-like domain-containing protein [Ideonella sp. BN130291]|uniref:ferritin-like domain-containing protein n=1 Tax=Ideonella sp. BN130291 TaxID=3112940 RepID=UPI002E26226F|nr:ferritin-like domain-containing protein [Ideonella sp. BN130291]